jgi:hypothetical protein
MPIATDPIPAETNDGSSVVTTEDETEAFMLVKAILRGTVDVSRVKMRDAVSYCAVLLDDNNRKPICRVHFNSATKKYITVFDAQKKETKTPIDGIDDILNFADQLKATVVNYESAQK